MNKVHFNIRLTKSVNMDLFIDTAKNINQIFDSESLIYEYTTNIEKVTYAEKKFKDFDSFNKFYRSNKYRFDLLELKNKTGDFYVGFQQSRRDLRVFGDISKVELFSKLIELFEQHTLYAYCHNDLDITLSRVNRHRGWIRKLGEIPSYIKLLPNRESTSEIDKYLIDLESIPTHHHLIKTGDKLWFGACAIMYFSEVYYKYIPKEKWDNFTNCEENVILENGLRKIVLYDDLSDFENPINRNKQWAFRRQLGIDEVAHKLIQDGSTPTVV